MNERREADREYSQWLSKGNRTLEERRAKQRELMKKYGLTSWIETSIASVGNPLQRPLISKVFRGGRHLISKVSRFSRH